MADRYQEAANWEESVLVLSIGGLVGLGVIALVGRLIDWRFREEIAGGSILEL
jgi:hypothetical protein